MTDVPTDEIELLHGMRGMAAAAVAFYKEVRDNGLGKQEALELTKVMLNAVILKPAADLGPDERPEGNDA